MKIIKPSRFKLLTVDAFWDWRVGGGMSRCHRTDFAWQGTIICTAFRDPRDEDPLKSYYDIRQEVRDAILRATRMKLFGNILQIAGISYI